MAGTAVTYNSTSIQTNDIMVSSIEHDSMPRQKTDVFAVARANRSVVTNRQYPEKIIVVRGSIYGTSLANLEQRIDDFKLAMTPSAGYANLDIGYNGGTRRYVAQTPVVTINRTNAMFAVEYALEFLLAEPFGIATSTTTHRSATTETTNPNTESLTLGGNAPEQYLTITYLLNSFTGAADNTVTFKNNTTGQQITITRTWAATNSLVIDVFNKSVRVNGVEVDYDGVFPVFGTGSQSLIISDNWSARNYSLTITQVNRFL